MPVILHALILLLWVLLTRAADTTEAEELRILARKETRKRLTLPYVVTTGLEVEKKTEEVEHNSESYGATPIRETEVQDISMDRMTGEEGVGALSESSDVSMDRMTREEGVGALSESSDVSMDRMTGEGVGSLSIAVSDAELAALNEISGVQSDEQSQEAAELAEEAAAVLLAAQLEVFDKLSREAAEEAEAIEYLSRTRRERGGVVGSRESAARKEGDRSAVSHVETGSRFRPSGGLRPASPVLPYIEVGVESDGGLNPTAAATSTSTAIAAKVGINFDSAQHLSAMLGVGIDLEKMSGSDNIQKKMSPHLVSMRLPRCVAFPVERAIQAISDQDKDLYDVLGVRRYCDEHTAKAAFRQSALLVHPDKNPHPYARQAFDALQEAFSVLGNPVKRALYDESLAHRRQARLSPRRLFKRLGDELYNHYSRFMLLQHRLRNGRAVEEWVECRESYTALKNLLVDVLEHMSLLPSLYDRVQLLNEIVFRHHGKTLLVSMIMGCLF